MIKSIVRRIEDIIDTRSFKGQYQDKVFIETEIHISHKLQLTEDHQGGDDQGHRSRKLEYQQPMAQDPAFALAAGKIPLSG